MGKGESRRKRESRAIRAMAEKRGQDPLLKLDKLKPKKQRTSESDIPASLRKMMQLKAAAEGKPRPLFAKNNHQKYSSNSRDTARNSLNTSNNGDSGTQKKHDEIQNTSVDLKKLTAAPMNDIKRVSAFGNKEKKLLKDKKKEFLKMKKLKKKGKSISSRNDDGDDNDSDDDPEEKMRKIAVATKPGFGVQAEAPISVNLKRRHWTDKEKTAADRCKEVFSKQMKAAETALGVGGNMKKGVGIHKVTEAQREEFVGMYRNKLKGDQKGATMQSLAKLVEIRD